MLEKEADHEQREDSNVEEQDYVAAHTGRGRHKWAGNKSGENFSVQGNILAGAGVLDAMADSFRNARGELADRLVAALSAAEAAGGDKRGKQSAGVLVVKPNGGYGGDTDRYLDLRVDDDEQPVKKLRQLVEAHHLFFGEVKEEDQLHIDEAIARELQNMMVGQGYMGGDVNGEWDEIAKQAFRVLVGNENLEERWSLDRNSDYIDRVALEYLRKRFG